MAQEAQLTRPRPFGDEITLFQTQALVVVHDIGPAQGTEIADRLSTEFGSVVKSGRFYPNMDALTDKGLVNKGQFDDRANAYSLTDKGEERLKNHILWELENGPVDDEVVFG